MSQKNKKIKILALVQLPPPIHGVSAINKQVVESKLMSEFFEFYPINIGLSSVHSSLGKFSFSKILKLHALVIRLIKILLLNKFCTVYFSITPTGNAFYRDCLYVFILKLFRKKIIYHLHGKGIKASIQHNLIKKTIYRLVFRKSKVIVLSKLLYKDIEDIVGINDINIVPNGVPTSVHDSCDDIARLKNQNSKIINLLFLSNLFEFKGVWILLESVKNLIKKDIKNFKLSISGNFGDITRIEFENYVKNNELENFVEYLGSASGDIKENYFLNADVFVYPTKNDAFPLVLLEAMSYGLPIVSTEIGGIPDMIYDSKNGFLVQSEDVEGIVFKLSQLIQNDRLRIIQGMESRKIFKEKYTLHHFEQNMLEAFKKFCIFSDRRDF